MNPEKRGFLGRMMHTAYRWRRVLAVAGLTAAGVAGIGYSFELPQLLKNRESLKEDADSLDHSLKKIQEADDLKDAQKENEDSKLIKKDNKHIKKDKPKL